MKNYIFYNLYNMVFIESHFPKNFNLIKFADITDSNQFPIYSKEENESIINLN